MGNLVQLAEGVYHLQGGSNIGLIVREGKAVAIDAGLDESAAKEVLRHVDRLGVRLAAVVVTHAHADHSGGAGELAKRAGAAVYATSLEAAVVRNPLLEPLYLYGGASPIRELTHKFTLAKAGPVDQIVEAGPLRIGALDLEIVPLFGHAPQQVGVRWGGVFFTADAFLPVETLEKHGIPFCVDLDEALRTLDRIAAYAQQNSYHAERSEVSRTQLSAVSSQLSVSEPCRRPDHTADRELAQAQGESPCRWYAPGHGPALADPAAVVQANRQRLEQIRALCLDALAAPAEIGAIVQHVAEGVGVALRDPVGFLLSQTTVLAALASCQRAGQAAPEVAGGRMRWRRV